MNYAEGREVGSAPPSLRVYSLAKQLPGSVFTNALDEDGQLVVELMTYAAEEARVANEEAQRSDRESRHASRSRVAGRRHSGR